MKDSKFNNFCSVLVITTLLLISFTSASYSQGYQLNKAYDIQSVNSTQKWSGSRDDFAGFMSDEEKILGVVVLAVGIGTLIYLIANNDSDETESKNTDETNDDDNSSDFDDDDYGFLSLLLKKETKEEIPINVYLGMKRNNNQFSDNTFQIGVSYNF